jgi:hypothetical protein
MITSEVLEKDNLFKLYKYLILDTADDPLAMAAGFLLGALYFDRYDEADVGRVCRNDNIEAAIRKLDSGHLVKCVQDNGKTFEIEIGKER